MNTYYNGTYGDRETIRIPLTDRSLWFGDGIYDAAICNGQIIYMLDEHIDRFFGNAKRLNIPLCFDRTELCEIFGKLTSTLIGCGFLYFQLSRFSEERCHSYPNIEKSNLLVTVTKIAPPSPDRVLKLISVPDIRYSLCDVKTLNLLPSVLAAKEAERQCADEAVFIRDGFVTECAHSNIAIIKDGSLITHPKDEHILPGTARARLIKQAHDLGIPVRERAFSYNELLSSDEVLVTSSTKLCLRAGFVDGRAFSIGNDSVGAALTQCLYADFYSKTH